MAEHCGVQGLGVALKWIHLLFGYKNKDQVILSAMSETVLQGSCLHHEYNVCLRFMSLRQSHMQGAMENMPSTKSFVRQ